MNQPYPRGAIVVGPDLVGPRNRRPYVLVSTEDHPFYGEEYTAVPVTSTPREAAIELRDDRFLEGELPEQSFAVPWNLVTLKHTVLSAHAGTLTEVTIESLVNEAIRYIRDR